jgi:transposase
MLQDRRSMRPRYPSDLSEGQWERVSPLIPAARPIGRPRAHPLRDVVDAINYRWETGCVWRMLPHDFPPWPTVYTYYRAWQRQGVLRQVREAIVRGRFAAHLKCAAIDGHSGGGAAVWRGGGSR